MTDNDLLGGTTQKPSLLPLTKTYRILTKVQNASAVVFSTFAVVHGAQVLVANVGGTRSANNWIVLGRPFYQDEHLEGLLVKGSAITHVIAGLSKLGIRYYWGHRKAVKPSSATTTTTTTTTTTATAATVSSSSSQNILTYHRWAGYALVPLAGLHYYLVRSIPIQFYGDSSFIDFGYIAWGLQNKPIFTYTLHTTLVVAASYHFVSGLNYLLSGKKRARTTSETTTTVNRNSDSTSIKSNEHQGIATQTSMLLNRNWVQKGLATTLSIAFISSIFIIGKETKKIPLRLDFERMYKYIL